MATTVVVVVGMVAAAVLTHVRGGPSAHEPVRPRGAVQVLHGDRTRHDGRAGDAVDVRGGGIGSTAVDGEGAGAERVRVQVLVLGAEGPATALVRADLVDGTSVAGEADGSVSGHYTLELPAGSSFHMSVACPGYHSRRVGPWQADCGLIETTLTPAGVITGTVVERDGRAVAGAFITASVDLRSGSGPPTTAISDASGAFRVASVARENNSVRASAPGYATSVVWEVAAGDHVTVRLPPGRQLNGALSQPITGTAEISLVPLGYPGVPVAHGRLVGDRVFEATGLAAARYVVLVDATPHGFGRAEVDLTSGDEYCLVEVRPNWTLRGRLEADGGAVDFRNCTVTLSLSSNRNVTHFRSADVTNDGHFEVPGMVDGRFSLDVRDRANQVALAPGAHASWRGRVAEPVSVHVVRTASVTGRVLDAGDRPVAGATLAPGASGQACAALGSGTTTSRPDGTFEIRGLRAFGPMQIYATEGRRVVGASPQFWVRPGREVVDVTVRLLSPMVIRGRVDVPAGVDPTTVRVYALRENEPIEGVVEQVTESARRGVPLTGGYFCLPIESIDRAETPLLVVWSDADGQQRSMSRSVRPSDGGYVGDIVLE